MWRSGVVCILLTVAYAAVPHFHSALKQGSIKSGTIDDPSGLAASRIHNDVYYTHNDHGGRNRVFAVNPKTGSLLAILTILGATNADWESIAVAPCATGGSCIYIGDFGSSAGAPRNVLYRVREPSVIRDQSLSVLQELHFRWNEPDCECLMVDNLGHAYVISRVEGGGTVAKIPDSGWTDSGLDIHSVAVTATQPLNINSGHHDPLGCDISADGKEMLIKGKEAIYYYAISNGDVLGAVKSKPAGLPYHYESLGEAIAWTPSGDGYYTVSQHHYSPFYFYAREGGSGSQVQPVVTQPPATNPPNTPLFANGQMTGLIKSFDLDGVSGMAASRVHSGIYYVHNDHGGSNRIFAMDPSTGEVKATYTISGATNMDWEDIAVGPCPGGGSCIYIGDTGHSGGSPRNIIYRVKEPTQIKDMTLPLLDKLQFTWNEPDSECLMVDPAGNAYVISKVTGGGQLAMLPASAWGSAPVSVKQTQSLSIHTSHSDPLACDLSANGKEMLIKGIDAVYYYKVTGNDVMAAVKAPVSRLPYEHENLGEAIAWTASGDGYYTVGQGHFLPFYLYKRQ